jgi:hypothetical protein
MAIDFPSSPVNGQTFSASGQTWIYNSSLPAWELDSPFVPGPTGPTGPTGAAGQWDTAQTTANKTASYTALTADAGKLITMTVGSANDFTVNASLDLSVGQRIDIAQLGTGQTTIVASGTTVNATPGLKLRAQYSVATLLCTAADVYLLLGDLSA